ncbi:MAG: glutathione synthase [Gammaproteobacteria bacterium]|nr:glutathione synthase [Gammaproteobacteria bacterium]|tara:strand:- start:434 stop:1393 length:960 start_codon:yes stop_codon:yes gene_type:complete
MGIKLGVVMDPIESITVKKDTTLAMLLAAQKRGWAINYMLQSDLYMNQGEPRAAMQALSVKDEKDSWYDLGGLSEQPLSQLDVILMRKDPPFNLDYIYSTYLLERAQCEGTLIVNDPRSLRDCNEKLFATQFPQCCPPVLVASSENQLKAFHDLHKDVIYKPLDGMGGTSIFRVKQDDMNLSVIIETLTSGGQRQIMAQKYIPEISAGDKRILMIDGKPIDYCLARIPSIGETRGNLAAGGSGVAQELSDRDRWICDEISPVLKEKGLLFVGLDIIGDYLTEVNVTSPTCLREIDRAKNLDIAGELMDCIEGKIETIKG